jgi:Kef-type K+ transport system membrane component KefB
MGDAWIPTLVLIAAIAALSPVIAELSKRIGIPSVVIELCLGIVVGPYVLGLAHPDLVVNGFSDMGLAFLMFLAGFELDLERIRGRPLQLAAAGWVASLVLAGLAGFAFVSFGLALDSVVLGLAFTTTALGTLLPVLRDAGVIDTDFGRYVMAVGTVGEFGPIVAVALLLTQKDPVITVLLLVLFVATSVAASLLAIRRQPPRVVAVLRRNLNSSAQLPVRVSVLLILLLIYMAFELGLDVLLGAFAAGIVVRFFTEGEDSEVIRAKLEAIGFGFLVPIFFIVSGIHFDLHALIHQPSALVRVPLFLMMFLIVRGLPVAIFYRKALPGRLQTPLALFSATGLPLIVVITGIGVSVGRMRPSNAAALVAAGILSVVLYPLFGLRQLRRAGVVAEGADTLVELLPSDEDDDTL